MSTTRILYVDDYPLDRALVRDALVMEESGFELVEADSRQEFERLITYEDFDLVLSDFNILGFTGLQVLETVQKKSPDIPVIIVTGTGSEEIAAEAIKRGAADYVIKSPQHIRRLPHTINSALEAQLLRAERQKAQEALRESEERYRLLFDHADVLISIYDHAGTCLLMNRIVAGLFGGKPDDFIGKPYGDLHPEEAPEYIRRIQEVIDHKKSKNYEDEVKFKHGKRWLLTNVQPLLDAQGKVYAAQIISQDITERKKAEQQEKELLELAQALRDTAMALCSTLEFEQVLDRILDNIWSVVSADAANLMLVENEMVVIARHRGYKGRDNQILNNSEINITDRPNLNRMFATGKPILINDTQKSSKWKNIEGGEWIRSYASTPIVVENDQVIGFINLDHSTPDFFEQKHIERLAAFAEHVAIALKNAQAQKDLKQRGDELKNLTNRLNEVEETERRRLARELHDQVGQSLALLNFNLNIIKGHAVDSENEKVDNQLADAISMVNEISQGIRDVMDDLRPSVLDDYGLVAALFWFADRYSERTGIKISVEGEEFAIRLSPQKENAVFRIAQEALINVARHAKANHVKISLEETKKAVVLEINDDGSGFEVAESVSPEERRGWGLVNMRERAESVGGIFKLITKPGRGSLIKVKIPK